MASLQKSRKISKEEKFRLAEVMAFNRKEATPGDFTKAHREGILNEELAKAFLKKAKEGGEKEMPMRDEIKIDGVVVAEVYRKDLAVKAEGAVKAEKAVKAIKTRPVPYDDETRKFIFDILAGKIKQKDSGKSTAWFYNVKKGNIYKELYAEFHSKAA